MSLEKRELYRLPWSKNDNPIAWLEITDICNLHCEGCYRQRLTGHKPLDEIKEEILFFKRWRNPDNVSIAGGEPLVHPQIVDIVAFIAENGLKPIVLTNAAMLTPELLRELKAAGLGSLPGGGAEVFAQRVRDQVCPSKISADEWLGVHKTAHRCGLPTNATMLYGHVETVEERVDHLIRLREAQDETGGFQAFIPLSFHPANTRLSHLPGPTGVEDLTVIAASRLLLDNFAHIKAYWIMLGFKLAQTALYFGADDLDGTVVEEVITRMAGGVTDGEVPVDELVQEVKAAGLVPVERDTFYETVRVYE